MKPVRIGNGSRMIDLPENFYVEIEDDGTVLTYIPGKDFVNLRISVVTVTHKTKPVSTLAFDSNRADAKERGIRPTVVGDKSYFSYRKDSVQDGEPLRIIYWEVGFQNSFIVLSACVIKRLESEPEVEPFLDEIPRIISSIRASS